MWSRKSAMLGSLAVAMYLLGLTLRNEQLVTIAVVVFVFLTWAALFGGHADVALKRASKVGDGWHGAFLSIAKTEELIQKLSNFKLRDSFVFSMRTSWDPLEDDQSQIESQIKEYMRVGVTHFVPEPRQRTTEDYMSSVRILRDILDDCGVSFI